MLFNKKKKKEKKTLIQFILIYRDGRVNDPEATQTERSWLQTLVFGLSGVIQKKNNTANNDFFLLTLDHVGFVCFALFCFGPFHCLLALLPKLLKEGNLKIKHSPVLI